MMIFNDIILILAVVLVFYFITSNTKRWSSSTGGKVENERLQDVEIALARSWEEWAELANSTNEVFQLLKRNNELLNEELRNTKERLELLEKKIAKKEIEEYAQ